ncbi:putative addiction module killer protein [Breoghania corrubedonensis]|uniref:Putative addiction module killer protein n=1 Tax=Breoghania corrubedonensis TaxID=665038 RepID=A0A2T5VE72_9HYPH|nr:type II toxin-antitoxin system RelE/ParE family toxin [Breoghania corrubedonensis]PTW62047.1 putative addiction module killer protein [Breoghania corrubedonensis]
MIDVRQHPEFKKWLAKLKDRSAIARIDARIRKLSLGNLGDVKPVGEGVSESRIHYGPGYRLYFVKAGETFIVLLCGGDKSTQSADIAKAKQLKKELD